MNNWSLVPPFTTYVPPPFYPRHPDAMHAHPVGDLPLPAFDVAARSPRAASSPSDGDGEAKHKGCRDGAGRPTATSSVESALRELHHQLAATHSIFIAYYSEWQNDKAKISYAEKETLENLWQDMLQAKAKSNADEAKMFHAAGEKITRCMQQARVAADNSCFLDVPGDSYLVDRRKRIVTKVGLSCDAIVELARKASHDPAACDMLLKEIDEAMTIVDPENEDLYGRAAKTDRDQARDDKDNSGSQDGQPVF